jgi:hypothetical protein
MKNLIILLAMIASSFGLSAQTLERYVIASAGGSYYDGVNMQMDFTAGELVITTVSNVSNILTQGFQQPFTNAVVAIAENQDDPIHVAMFPNPFYDELNIEIGNAKESNYHAQILDILGQLIMEETTSAGFDGKTIMHFDAKNLAPGTYFIRVMHDQKVLLTRKAVKVSQ